MGIDADVDYDKLYMKMDNYFSTWIFAFFIIYYMNISYFNPFILLILGLVVVIVSSIYVYIESQSMTCYWNFILINIYIKVIPLLLIWNRPIYYHDVIITIFMILIYYSYATFYNKIDIFEFYINIPDYHINEYKNKMITTNE